VHDRGFLRDLLSEILSEYQISGLSVSLLDSDKQYVKFGINYANEDVIAREASLDGHAVLSKGKFILKDASRDWRTRVIF
jgi:predicted acetyltransferase